MEEDQELQPYKGIIPVASVKTEIIPPQTSPEISPGAPKLKQSPYICFTPFQAAHLFHAGGKERI